MAKLQPINPTGQLLTIEDIRAYYTENQLPTAAIDVHFPLSQTLDGSWRTIMGQTNKLNIAADPIESKSSIPVSGRRGYKSVQGELATFGKAFEMDADDFERWHKLQENFARTQNADTAAQLLAFWDDDLANVRRALDNERRYLCYSLISNACSISFAAANSPYLRGLAAMEYPIESWQKDYHSGNNWNDASKDIIGDIQTYFIEPAKTRGFKIRSIKVSSTLFNYIRKNTAIQKYCATLVMNIYNTQAPPTLEAINAMLVEYFGVDAIQFEVIDDLITRENADGSYTTANPFNSVVAVGSPESTVGRFQWKQIYTESPQRETQESFFMVGSYKEEKDVPYGKVYGKAHAFPAVDAYNQMIFFKTNATVW